MKERLLIAILAAALIASVLPLDGCGRQTPGGKTMTVRRETLPLTVMEVGQIEPKDYEVVAAPISGILVELVKEGTLIHKGDVVYEGAAEQLVADPKAREIYLGPEFNL